MCSTSEEAVVAELIQLHLVETDTGSGSWHSPVVANLPTSRLGDMKQEEIAKLVPIRKDLVSSFSHESTATKVYQWIMAYEEAKGYLNYTRVNARILACELLKEWAYEHRHLGDRGIDVHCLCRYKEFAGHLLYFHDRWADTEHGATRSKILGQPHGIIRSKNKETFVSTLVKVHEALAKLQQSLEKADSSETHCSIYLGQLDELFQQMLHQAASICFLGPTEHHEEMTASHTEFSLEFLVKQRRSIQGHSGEVFWSTDWGRLLDAALRQGDPERFQPLGAWVIFYQEKGTTCKMCRYYSQQSAETRLRQIAKPAILLGPAPDYRRILNRKEFESQAEPLLEAIDAHLLAIGAKEPEVNQAATDGDLWDFLNDPPKIFDFLQTLPEESGSSGRARTRSECSSTPDSEMTRSMMEDNQDSSEGVLSQEVELVRAKWVARNWTRCGLSAALLGESAAGPTFGPDVMANVVLQMAEDFAALLEIRRTILVPLEGVCMQLGTLRSRRILHAALARLSLHVDQFVECAQQFHQIFEARLFESLRSVDSKPDPAAAARAPRPAVQRSYRRSIQRAFALRREICKKVQQLGETVPLQSAEDEQCSFDKLKSSMAALAQALSSPGAGGGAYLTDARTLALADAPRASLKSKRQSMKANSVLVVD